MLVASIFAASLNFSAFRWVALPWPAEAKFMLPGLARAAASSSCKVLMFLAGEITSTLGVRGDRRHAREVGHGVEGQLGEGATG